MCSFKKINKIDKLTVRLIRGKKKANINNAKIERDDRETNCKNIKRKIRKHYQYICVNKVNNLDEMERKIFERQNISKLT